MAFLKERHELFKLNKKLKKLYRLYDADIQKAEGEGKGYRDINVILAEKSAVCREYEFEINKIQSRILTHKARKAFIDIPEYSEEKYWENDFGYSLLSERGMSLLNRKLREHKKVRVEFFVKIIVALAVLVGAITGLVAILNK